MNCGLFKYIDLIEKLKQVKRIYLNKKAVQNEWTACDRVDYLKV